MAQVFVEHSARMKNVHKSSVPISMAAYWHFRGVSPCFLSISSIEGGIASFTTISISNNFYDKSRVNHTPANQFYKMVPP